MKSTNSELLSILTCLTVAACCQFCGNDTGTYSPSDVSKQPEVADLVSDDDVWAPDCNIPPIPDRGPVALDDVEPLIVKIVSPSPAPSFSVQTGNVVGNIAPTKPLSGFVFGRYDKMWVETDDGFQIDVEVPVDADRPFSYFQTQPIPFRGTVKTGDKYEAQATIVRVYAQKGDRVAYDAALVMANPGFEFPGRLRAAPDVIFVAEPTALSFTLDLNRVENFDSEQVYLMETDETCNVKVGLGEFMHDDGDPADSGDEVAEDRVYTRSLKLCGDDDACEAGQVRLFRAAVTSEVQGELLVAYTPCVAVRIVESLSPADCLAAQTDLQEAGAVYDALLACGDSTEEARKSTVSFLKGRAGVAEAGASEENDLIWVAFESGVLGAVQPTECAPGIATALYEEIGETPASPALPDSRLAVASFHDECGTKWDEFVSETQCPPIEQLGHAGRVTTLRRMSEAGLLFLGARGGFAFGGLSKEYRSSKGYATGDPTQPAPIWTGWESDGAQDVVWLTDEFSCEDMFKGPESCHFRMDGKCCVGSCPSEDNPDGQWCPDHLDCVVVHAAENGAPIGFLYDRSQADLMAGRLVLGREGLGALPAFVNRYANFDVGNQFAFLGYPGSFKAGALASEIVAAGANTVVGTKSSMDAENAEKSGVELVTQLIEDDFSPSVLLPRLGDGYSGHDWRYVGAGSVQLSHSGLINSDFANGDLRGWTHTGDARIMAEWCGQYRSEKYMLLISTGIGYTVQTGFISQTFCLPEDKVQLEASYDFISHEFIDQCGGDGYNDDFQMFLEDLTTGDKIAVSKVGASDAVTVNHHCPPDSGVCGNCPEGGNPLDCDCGALYEETLEPWPLECSFMAEDSDGFAYHSTWRQLLPVNVSALAGLERPLRLILEVNSDGGLGFPTSVLVDSISLK